MMFKWMGNSISGDRLGGMCMQNKQNSLLYCHGTASSSCLIHTCSCILKHLCKASTQWYWWPAGCTWLQHGLQIQSEITWSWLRGEVLQFRSRRRLHLRNLARLLLVPLLCLLLQAPVVLLYVVFQFWGQSFHFFLELSSLWALILIWRQYKTGIRRHTVAGHHP